MQVNCDDDAGNSLCRQFDVQGFPTLYWIPPHTAKKDVASTAVRYGGRRNGEGLVSFVQRALGPPVLPLELAIAPNDNAIDSKTGSAVDGSAVDSSNIGGVIEQLGQWVSKHSPHDKVAYVALQNGGASFTAAASALYLTGINGVTFGAPAPQSSGSLAVAMEMEIASNGGNDCDCVTHALRAVHSSAELVVARL